LRLPTSKHLGIFLLAAVTFLLALVVLAHSNNTAEAQEETATMKAQLEHLREQMDAGELLISFQFVTPISDNKNIWTFGDLTDEMELTIQEIGDDHFCFTQRGEQAVLMRCVPYTNIASYSYLVT
jgi:hypothetical protein